MTRVGTRLRLSMKGLHDGDGREAASRMLELADAVRCGDFDTLGRH